MTTDDNSVEPTCFFLSLPRLSSQSVDTTGKMILPLLKQTNAFLARFMSAYPSNPVGSELLMTCTTRRWLYNNDKQMALRQLDFDVEALGAIAAKACGASECNEIEVVGEGTFNRVFRLSLDTGNDVVARIPFRNAGPRSLLTRSEVATMDFVRSRIGAPVPKVLAWDASSDNNVGCEYIIMEKCKGNILANVSDSSADSCHIFDIANLLSGLGGIPFSQYGSIYYKEDVDPLLQAKPLYAEGQQPDDCSERFRIGPSVERRFYRGERARLLIDRGPWTDVRSYIKAAVDCEMKWIQSYSNSPCAQNQLGARHSAVQHIVLLKKWLSLAPSVLPSHEHCIPTLSHPDLHAANVFVNDDDSMSVAAIIDWQGAAIRPLFETVMPDLVDIDTKNLKYAKLPGGDLQQPVLPDNFDELGAAQKSEAHAEVRRVASNHQFLKLVRQLRPALYAALRLHQMEDMRRAIYYSSHSWSDGLPLLEQCLLSLTVGYGDYIPTSINYPVCPVIFSEEDAKRHEKEFRDIIYPEEWLDVHIRALMRIKGILLHRDGSVDEEDFEEARKKADESFVAISTAMDEERAEKFRRHWPMREGKFVLSMESCM